MSEEKEIKRFKIEEIGSTRWGSSLIDIHNKFFGKHLSKFTFPAPFNYGSFSKYNPIDTDIACPYCEIGVLQLTDKKKDICEIHVCHNGNSYQFHCSEHCNEFLFSYRNTWLYC